MRQLVFWVIAALVSVAAAPAPAQNFQSSVAQNGPAPGTRFAEKGTRPAVLWTDPGDIRARNLFYGPGGKDGQPRAPFQFEQEDAKGTSPKFDIRDGSGEKWKVKLGVEARPETAAARLLWAVGYTANTNFFLEELHVDGMPPQISRGMEWIDHSGNVKQARLQRKPGKDHKTWSWSKNPFRGTREFNGLRVMMALLHNWDLKDDNNARYKDKEGHEVYYVTDLGASFGTTGKSYTEKMSKDNFDAYRNARFLSQVTPQYVSFNFPTHPALYRVFNLPSFVRDIRIRWLGRKIPRHDVEWIASLLAQLTPEQIHDAFRAAGYSPEQIEQYSQVLQARIAELSKL